MIEALSARSIIHPFPVQELVIRDALAGHDLLVQSPTGSGKTLAFGLPLVDLIEPQDTGPQVLILAPTRELVSQIVEELAPLAEVRRLRIASVYGGVGFGPQIAKAKRADIIAATPGRLEDLIDRGAVALRAVRVLVLDEADRMLDMGFRPAVDRIVGKTPSERQTLFFSATLAGATGAVAAAYTYDARSHTHQHDQGGESDVEHRFLSVESQAAKLDRLVEHLREDAAGRSLVFVRTKRGADRLVKRLRGRDVEAVAMHGDKSQRQRELALDRFERGKVLTLVATDVAARGIDVADVELVVNYDAPEDREAYVHRVGRTGRAGRSGASLSFVLADQATEMRGIAKDLGLHDEFAELGGLRAAPGDRSRAGDRSRPSDRPQANDRPRAGDRPEAKRRRRRRRRPSKIAA